MTRADDDRGDCAGNTTRAESEHSTTRAESEDSVGQAREQNGSGVRVNVTFGRGVAMWFGLALYLTAIFTLSDSFAGLPVSISYLLALALPCAALWIAAAPLVWRFVGRLPPWPAGSLRAFGIHTIASLAFSTAGVTAFGAALYTIHQTDLRPDLTYTAAFRSAAYYFLLANSLFYWVVLAARLAFDMSARLQHEATRRARLEEQLVRSRLDVLRMQMSPHFLFNTLNSIAGLVRTREGARAVDMIARLGNVLRGSLEESREPFAPVESEVRNLEGFIEIERCRFGDRLDFEVSIAPGAEERMLPRWLLQPLVENAIRHGIESSADAGRVRVRISERQSRTCIVIEDDGVGMPPRPSEGIGLGNTRRRLEELYGSRWEMHIDRLTPGTRLTLLLPETSAIFHNGRHRDTDDRDQDDRDSDDRDRDDRDRGEGASAVTRGES